MDSFVYDEINSIKNLITMSKSKIRRHAVKKEFVLFVDSSMPAQFFAAAFSMLSKGVDSVNLHVVYTDRKAAEFLEDFYCYICPSYSENKNALEDAYPRLKIYDSAESFLSSQASYRYKNIYVVSYLDSVGKAYESKEAQNEYLERLEKTIKVTGTNAGNFVYTSENEEIAKVSSSGVVTGVKPGKTYIVITESNGGSSMKVAVSVEKTLNARFEQNGNGITSISKISDTCKLTSENPTSCNVEGPTIKTDKGYTAIGWSTDNLSETGSYELTLTEDTTFYSVSKKDAITLTAKFNANGAKLSDVENRTCTLPVAYNKEPQLTSCTVTTPVITGSEATPVVLGFSENDANSINDLIGSESNLVLTEINNNHTWYAITKSNPITYEAIYEKYGAGVNGIGATKSSCTIPTTYNGKEQDKTCNITLTTITVNEGYTVIGWNKDNTSHEGLKVGSQYALSENTTLYSISKKNPIIYTAKFEKNGLGVTGIGATTASCTIDEVFNNEEQKTSCDIELPSITVEGLWKALGWSEEAQTHDNYVEIEKGITLTKLETTLYSITKKDTLVLNASFNANGATLSTNEGISCTLNEVYNNEQRNDYCVLTTPEVTRDNFEFVGFNQDANNHNNDSSYDKESNQIKLDTKNTGKTWYAITKRDLKVEYDKNGSEKISKTEDGCTIWNSNTSCNIKTATIERETFDILGWNENKDADVNFTDTIDVDKDIQISDNKKYYAITKKDVTISYDKNNAIGQTNELGDIVYDNIVTRNCTISNREETCSIKSPSIVAPYATPNIVGYGINNESTTSAWNVITTKNVTDSAKYYAITKNDDITYTVNFEKQGLGVTSIGKNSASCTIKATYNGEKQATSCAVEIPTIAVEEGYTSLGWSTNKNATTDYITDKTIEISENKTLYAISKKDAITLTATFNKNGAKSQNYFSNGTIVTSTDDKVKISCVLAESFNNNVQATSCKVSVPVINASDETPEVIGYANTSTATEKSLEPNTELTITKDVEYYAITKKDSVSFDANFDANNSTLSSTSKLSCNIPATYNGVSQAKSCTVTAPTITANENTPTIVGYNLESNATTNNSNYDNSTKKLTLNNENTGKVWYAITKKNTVTYNVKYEIGDHVTSISKTSGKCVIPETYNGVEQTKVCIIREDDKENNPEITPNKGYTSIGWSQLESSTAGSPAIVLSKDNMTFYAHASANHYNINYYSDNRLTGVMSVTYDEPFNLQTIEKLSLTKRGYTFNSWTSNGVTYKDGAKISENLASEEGENVRFDANWDDLEKPVCRFVQVGATTTQNQTTVKMECTDTGSGVVQKTLVPSDFVVSNTTNGVIDKVSAPTPITDGYSYDLTVRGLSVGTFNVTIPKDKIVDNSNNGILEATTPTSVVVTGRTYTIKYTKGDNVDSIAATSDTCVTTGSSIVCNVILPGITASKGYTTKGWLNDKNVTTQVGQSYELTETTTGETLTATSVDITPPQCSISGNPTNWTQSATLTVSATDDGIGLDNAPYSWTSKTEGFSTTATKSISANGEYKAYAKDKAGNVGECSVNATKIDTTKPSCTFSDISDTTIVSGNTATLNLTCTDTQSLINTNQLATTNFTVSSAVAKVTNVSAPTTVSNGYKYTVTVQGVSYGAFTVSLNANVIKDTANNYNIQSTSTSMTSYNKAATGSCNTLTYNGSSQTLVSNGTGVTYADNSKVDAGNHIVTITPTSQYKYSDETSSKSLTCNIKQKEVTYTADSASKTYDGAALTKTTATLTSGSLVSGHTSTPSISGTITNVGSTTNTLNSITIKSGTTDVTANYKITKANGTLTISKRATTCTATTTSKTYDGSALSSSTGSCSNLVSGQTVTFTNSGSITNAGSTTNTVSSVVIKSGSTDVSSNYTITKANGTLTVNKRATTCTAGSSSRAYNGSALTNTTGSCTNLVSGHTSTFTNTGTITNVGSVTNTLSSVVIKSGSTNVSSNYTITKANGTLTVTKAASTNPTLTAYSGTYDGASHTITVSGGSGGTIQYSTDNATWSTTKPTRTNVGTTTVYVRVLGDSNHNSTSSVNATITISKRATTCTAGSSSRVYNGSALTNTTGGSCTNLVSGHTTTFSNTGTITNAGSTTNTLSSVVIKSGSTDVSSNYTITKANGTLTVTKAASTNPTLTAYSGTYDGASHTITVSGGSGGTIQYSTDNATWSTTKPTRTSAGTTTVYVRILGDSNHNNTTSISADIKIDKAKPIITFSSTSGTATVGSSTTFTVSSNLEGSFSVDVDYPYTDATASVSTTSTVSAGTKVTVTATAKVADRNVNINVKFAPSDITNYYIYEPSPYILTTKGITRKLTFSKSTGVSSIGSTSASCTTTGSDTSCTVSGNLPSISVSSGYVVDGWYLSGTYKGKPGDSYSISLSSNATIYARATETATINPNIVWAKVYSTDSATKCISGDESTCITHPCGSLTGTTCSEGTIIEYKVNSTTTQRFHVLYNNTDGKSMTLISQRNIVPSTTWRKDSSATDPLHMITALESATTGWTNVKSQSYSSNTTFKYNSSNGCIYQGYSNEATYSDCKYNVYSFSTRIAKARVLTFQEAYYAGCTTTSNDSCPLWLYNYLDDGSASKHWLNTVHIMSTSQINTNVGWTISSSGKLDSQYQLTATSANAVRAVVQIDRKVY